MMTAELLYLYLGLLCSASNVVHSVLGDSGDSELGTELDGVGDWALDASASEVLEQAWDAWACKFFLNLEGRGILKYESMKIIVFILNV